MCNGLRYAKSEGARMNPVAKHFQKFNKNKVEHDRKKEAKKTGRYFDEEQPDLFDEQEEDLDDRV